MKPVHVSTDVSRDEWNTYVDAHPEATAYHAWDWRLVFERAFSHRTDYLVARRGPVAVGVLPLVAFEHSLFGRFMVSLPFVNYGGVLADDEDAGQALLAEATERAARSGAAHVELRHVHPRFARLPRKTHKVSMTLELAPDVEAQWARLNSKVRNHIRKAEKNGLAVHAGGTELLTEFYDVFARNMRDLGTPVYPRAWFSEILDHFPDRARLTIVRSGDRSVAAALTLGFRGSLEVPSSGSLREYRSSSANTLLFWHLIKQGLEGGFHRFDFGRSSPDDGAFRFKEQWGAVPGPLTWEYVLREGRSLPDRSPKNQRYRLAIRAWQRLPLGAANRLGPSIVRFLP